VSRRIWIKTSISRRSGEARVHCCEKILRCCGSYYSMLRTSSVQHPTREVSIDVASLCVSCCERQGSQHSVFRGKIAQGRTGSLPPPGSRLPRGVRGGAKVLCSPVRVMAHILQGIECPHRVKPSPTALSTRLDGLLEGDLQIR
jgi:hypothetical protein